MPSTARIDVPRLEAGVHATIRRMVAAAGGRFDIVHGETFTTRIDGGRVEVPLKKDDKRPDVSKVSLFVRAAIDAKPDRAAELIVALRDFVEHSERVGRTEIDVDDETALSLTRPERYRHEIVRAIAEDTAKVRAELGAGCKVLISGLSSRIGNAFPLRS